MAPRLVLLLGALIALAAPASADPPTLRVVCWNVNQAVGTDGKRNLARVARVLRAARPDLVALQEVTADQRAALATGLGWKHHLFAVREGHAHGVAWLGRWALAERQVLPLPKGKDRRRGSALAAAVQLPAAGGLPARRLIVVTTQLDADRHKAFAQAAKLNERFTPVKTASLLAGDMGQPRKSQVLKVLDQRWEAPSRAPADAGTAHVVWRPDAAFEVVEYRLIASDASDRQAALIVLRRKPEPKE